ncbi:UDP-N-acetylmuramoyl-L-alanyl-D-glutamate--2,6-diaminopimelate ligase [Thiomicrorhabdus sp. ZW0627]|uniref:UDP-N-acetylmuramoyl-L-alanyl-D-glutamate--2, 6-diaminopimelate ligase n=1 Tax=Thiomicrorhabdus sp. ZW0627 TaxID=3039774 RepID=UPI00243710EB|nr:UDP-N-acetylmuramoyl-L-alanyl-D-glutamate--2,6-diaminopimelate ligase [Thiomicrorhabdus sp. ZW0627]MDG6774018.1 UDP-N-acetylmuramoyl-L-alanyl-D-glutamate--2,6-diaminopimelate ligase [Thiomicrorhabdus sp. ZW0627]
MKTLQQIYEFFGIHESCGESGVSLLSSLPEGLAESIRVKNLSLDSRNLESEDGFIGIQGYSQHGLVYLQQAVDAGVSCVLSDRPLTETEQAWFLKQNSTCVVIVVDDLNTRLGKFADWFYDRPSLKIKVVGITGTNGKTSTAHYVSQLLLALGQKPALIGTLGNGVLKKHTDKLSPGLNTTPDVVSVHRLLNEFNEQGANWVVMEVSSHALELGRIDQLQFECVALTQVTRDHLDFHQTEQAYRAAKSKLFLEYESRVQVINGQDALGQELMPQLPHALIYHVDTQDVDENGHPHLYCSERVLNAQGMNLDLNFAMAHCKTSLPLMGAFNIENALCAVGIMMACCFDWAACCQALPKLSAVNGRMQVISGQPTAIVDFAHTPDALEKVLSAVREHLHSMPDEAAPVGRLWIVFGCGGDRDSGKRPMMAKAAERLADEVVLTSDNPRYESPQQIIEDTLVGFERPSEVKVIEDRAEAIHWALQSADAGDVVVIAGKGHEAYQDIKGKRWPFSDQLTVSEWFEQAGNRNGGRK